MNIGMRLTAGLISATALVLAGCSASDDPAPTQSAAESTTQAAQESGIVLSQGVVRAVEDDSDMTAIFGTLENSTDSDIEVTGFYTSAEAEMNQLHQTINGQMSQMSEPLRIPAHGTFELAPGGNHLMLMGLHQPIKAGESIDVTLELKDGGEVDLGAVPARAMGAGGESYGDLAEGHGGHGGEGEHQDHQEMTGMDSTGESTEASEQAS